MDKDNLRDRILGDESPKVITDHPQRKDFEDQDEYFRAWAGFYGVYNAVNEKLERTQIQWRRLIKRYGFKGVCEMDDLNPLQLKKLAGMLTFKDKIAAIRKSKS